MSEVKKIATRESYGNALVELGREHTDLVVLQKQIWLESQQDFLPAVKFHS